MTEQIIRKINPLGIEATSDSSGNKTQEEMISQISPWFFVPGHEYFIEVTKKRLGDLLYVQEFAVNQDGSSADEWPELFRLASDNTVFVLNEDKTQLVNINDGVSTILFDDLEGWHIIEWTNHLPKDDNPESEIVGEVTWQDKYGNKAISKHSWIVYLLD
ncbi:hypothetical protein [Aliiglaciecola lipolytica]|uniref:Uncharacterized protein n=1 Tax=Aliiglaciecola lipolytica E3 TaxID=1127673 RepID=K6X7T4_9ALTE|nr:hypothetical protein [Aliiglaciecola lipolytica]GAC16684.1 hypothetical protein GLIP_4073 [Aliiglaciecola lipolytica E3]